MTLNERKIKILEAIISSYIITADPVGSRTIAKKFDFGISSATIRNEMSDLEEMGFILQPHASAGRIPTDRGYRLYVDALMRRRELTAEEAAFLQNLIVENIDHIDNLMKETARAITFLTNYTTVVTEPSIRKLFIKRLQLVPVDESTIVLVIVTNDKIVKNHTIRLQNAPDISELDRITKILNEQLSGKSPTDISDADRTAICEMLRESAYVFPAVIDTILSSFDEEYDTQIYTSGVKNILAFPEFSDLGKARAVFDTLEEKELLITMLNSDGNGNDIKVVIGSENQLTGMKDCSIIKAEYGPSKYPLGAIGIIGPTRMDYTQVISVLNGIVKYIDYAIKSLKGG